MKGVFAKAGDMDRAPAELWRVRSSAERNGEQPTNGAPAHVDKAEPAPRKPTKKSWFGSRKTSKK